MTIPYSYSLHLPSFLSSFVHLPSSSSLVLEQMTSMTYLAFRPFRCPISLSNMSLCFMSLSATSETEESESMEGSGGGLKTRTSWNVSS